MGSRKGSRPHPIYADSPGPNTASTTAAPLVITGRSRAGPQAVVLPRLPRFEPLRGLPRVVLTQSLCSPSWEFQCPARPLGLGVAAVPHGSPDVDGEPFVVETGFGRWAPFLFLLAPRHDRL